jgi:hypothetical protein
MLLYQENNTILKDSATNKICSLSPEKECGSYLTAALHPKTFSHRHPKAVSRAYFAALKPVLSFS